MTVRNKASNSGALPLPRGSIVFVQIEEHEWTFKYPRITARVLDRFDQAVEMMENVQIVKAESEFRQMLVDFPEFIDAYHHLAMVMENTKRVGDAFATWEYAVDIGLRYFPRAFVIGRDLLPWYYLDNRPFLRAYHGYSLHLLEYSFLGQALKNFTEILAMDPNDHLGIRVSVINCFFRLGRPDDVLSVCDNFTQDISVETVYGKVLALLQLELMDEATIALRDAIRILPLVVKELTKRTHQQPPSNWPGLVTHGGADQAYEYWRTHGEYWANTPGAIDFIMKHQNSR